MAKRIKKKPTDSEVSTVIGANGKARAPRADDANHVMCMRCAGRGEVVYMAAYTKHNRGRETFTHYKCSQCGETTKRANYAVLRSVHGIGELKGDQAEYSAR